VLLRETASRPDVVEMDMELRRFAEELRSALRAAGAVPNGDHR